MRIGGEGSTALRPLARAGELVGEVLWPTRCVGCGMPGELLCEDCRKALPWVAQRWACPNCGAPFGGLTCTECGERWETRVCVCALGFRGTPARLVTDYKDGGERRLAPVIAAALEVALTEASALPAEDGALRFDADAIDGVCFVPATPAAYARRGFDHMEDVARELSQLLGLPLADVLVRDDARDQRLLGREARSANLSDGIGVLGDVCGMDLLLVDDVVTTGATVRACARALLARGASSVTACALARVW